MTESTETPDTADEQQAEGGEAAPEQDPGTATTPRENPPADDQAVEEGEDKLDQVSGN